MTCIETGAVVHDIPHGIIFCADLFEVEGAIVVRANGPIKVGVNAFPDDALPLRLGSPTHELHDRPGSFWRRDLGVFVVAKAQVVRL
jgi:hypothetical protein